MATTSAQSGFTGFSPLSTAFFTRLAENNSKEWFEAHRQEYEDVLLTPFKALVRDLSCFMLGLDAQLVTEPARVVARINRDVRFSHDKAPYKTNLWLVFRRFVNNWQSHPCWFFELAADWYRYGMGFYNAPRTTMEAFRNELALHPDRFRGIVAPLLKNGSFTVEGERYKKTPKPEPPQELREWGGLKNLYVVRNSVPDEVLFSPLLIEEIQNGFTAMQPLYTFLWSLAEQK